MAVTTIHDDGDDDSENDNDNENSGGDSNNSRTTPTSWIGWKERGRQAYIRGDYDVALQAYTQALHHRHHQHYSPSSSSSSSNLDQQILLSNMVACRLKLGGSAQAEAAVENAKRCIALNDQWAKGYVRLASAYIALGQQSGAAPHNPVAANSDEMRTQSQTQHQQQGARTSHSNDACNALQRALQLDPGNPAARDMLIRELRSRDHGRQSISSRSNINNGDDRERSNSGAPRPSAPPQHMDTDSNMNTDADDRDNNNNNNNNSTSNNTRQHNQHRQEHQEYRAPPRDRSSSNNGNNMDHEDVDIDDTNSRTWKERMQFQIQRGKFWYSGQSEDVQSVLKVALAIVLLYVAFGGRFGLDYFFNGNTHGGSSRSSRRHSGSGGGRSNDVYDEFYRSRNERNNRRPMQQEDHTRHSYGRHSYSSNSNSSSSSSGYGYYAHMLLLAVVVYVARLFGISPYQAIFFVNMLVGRRGGGMIRGRRGFGGGYFGGGNLNFRQRPGGMWR
uniref:Uncharacterized protein n=1 Tax=Pseudo-nitzschia australis TaxID=44445 RepID=A0A7S4EI96_9STRA|mmetsp:Transcript_16793/g.36648  ORF Transcript_16793/g.36648 Transcript_16793/m.36648 type:complete len:502 (-) Transcript_16793:285-1790(-)|eukprot:CAMPEP_0168174396 /NCGR_PEP_ID=MMETSP0139_2-20121125/6472_1 /TAXON_ID=44445 /ORGANISM="Pseudo-nitzschia australis, Strain 10249 10 AB" /LENGTH=501 /DNA_ID=CAMNT_0008092525 /DNA_START=114 /DNA_END=1619 /DNA_ORIENTATION=-